MKFKVELGFVDPNDESKNIFYSTYVEADGIEAIDLAKKKQPVDKPELEIKDRWFWCAFKTHEAG